MKAKSNVDPGKFKKKHGYSRINLHSRKEKDSRAIAKAEESEKGDVVKIKSTIKVVNPDRTSKEPLRRGDAIVVAPKKRDDGLIEADYKHLSGPVHRTKVRIIKKK